MHRSSQNIFDKLSPIKSFSGPSFLKPRWPLESLVRFQNSSLQCRYIVIVIAYVSKFACKLTHLAHRVSKYVHRKEQNGFKPFWKSNLNFLNLIQELLYSSPCPIQGLLELLWTVYSEGKLLHSFTSKNFDID